MSLQIEQWGLVPYGLVHDRQMQLVERLQKDGSADDVCLMVQHPAVFTLGRNGSPDNVTVSRGFLRMRNIELIRVERGGEITYHGPGQLVCYPIIRLHRNRLRVVEYIDLLEEIMLRVLAHFGIEAARDPRNHGVWCGDRKLGSVGIAVRHGVSYHGMALNVNLDMEPFGWVNPCGMSGVSMGSMEQQMCQGVSFEKVEQVMKKEIIQGLTQSFTGEVGQSLPREGRGRGKVALSPTAKPNWLKQRLPKGAGYEKMRRLLRASTLHTVCQEARCPNQFECFAQGTATFMLMGENCTRNCGFCAVGHRGVSPLDHTEPQRISDAVSDLGLGYAVLTSVTRDDLADGGADHFGKTIDAIRRRCLKTRVEVLIPDLQGDRVSLESLCGHGPSVLGHNVETVPSLYPEVRPLATYERSLTLLREVKEINPAIVTKSGLMLGLGEDPEELYQTLSDIRATGCDLLTLGQYLQPTARNLPVRRYVPPEEFDRYRDTALKLGFTGVAAGPHVRSSYQADELYASAI